jgi:hypothetical protein
VLTAPGPPLVVDLIRGHDPVPEALAGVREGSGRIAARRGKPGDKMPSEIKPSASITRVLDAETS